MPSTTTTIIISILQLPMLLILLTHLGISDGYSDLSLNSFKSGTMEIRVCEGNGGNCPAAMPEFEVDNRRELMGVGVGVGVRRKFVSYETLNRDLVPCSFPGSSYYNCGSSPEANRYTRGCSVITRCARF